ncbi:kinase-like domain-containing protein [Paraphysoderma sedebokerense]|nr:kinase-like domain-containing protein [Paraphysoderma sedebokerense]
MPSSIFNSKREREKHYRSVEFSTNIQDYELMSPIGGVDDISYMYLSRYIPTQDLVALKYTDLTISPDWEFLEELMVVIKNTAVCKHSNTLPYFTSFVEHERLWTVTLPMQAGSCRAILREYFPDGFTETIAATILKQVLKAIRYLHAQGYIHNDLRADNVLVDANGDVRLTGFHQLLYQCGEGGYKRQFYEFNGLPEWMAPECMEQNSFYDAKADIYSFGIMALELAYGRTPFDDWPPFKIMLSKLLYECPTEELNPTKKMSRHFFAMVKSCLHKDPSKRPTAEKLLEYPFFKVAKNSKYIESRLIKLSGICKKHGVYNTILLGYLFA